MAVKITHEKKIKTDDKTRRRKAESVVLARKRERPRGQTAAGGRNRNDERLKQPVTERVRRTFGRFN